MKDNDSTAIYHVELTADFKITGQGNSNNWDKAQ